MKARLFTLVIAVCCFVQPLLAQNNEDARTDTEHTEKKAPRPKANWDEMLGTTSGIGVDLYRPPLVSAATVDKPWANVNLLLYCMEIQAGFGKIDADASKLKDKDPWGTYLGTPGKDVYGRNFSVGVNLPIAPNALGFGNGRPGSMLRGHFFGAFNIGGMALWEQNKEYKSSIAYMGIAPGFRIYNNLLSAEFRLQGTLGLKSGKGYEDYFKSTSLMPVMTFRMNGLFAKLVQGQSAVGNTTVNISDVRSTSTTSREYRSDGVYDVTRTTTTANVSTSHGTSVLNDIGKYVGIGPRISFTRPMATHYAESSMLGGATANFRNGKFLMGLNVETGRVGHGSITKKGGDDKRTVDRSKTYGKGSLNATNTFFDIGMDISSVAKALLMNTFDDENKVTTFASLNVGYSLGYSFIGNQRFDNAATAVAAYDKYFANGNEERNKKNDPAMSKSGLVGGFFLGFDIGSVGFRVQAYRYRNAPLANNLYYTLCYRF